MVENNDQTIDDHILNGKGRPKSKTDTENRPHKLLISSESDHVSDEMLLLPPKEKINGNSDGQSSTGLDCEDFIN